MHHLVFGINFQIHFVSLVSPVSIHLFHFSTHLCHHRHSHHPSLLHFFTPGSKPTFSTNPFHLNFSSLLIDFGTVFMILGLDRTYHAHKFIFLFLFFLFRVVD